MLTARQFSKRAGVSYPTVMKWLKAGLVPEAKLNENTPLGTYWEIPVTSVGKVEKEKPGPKPKLKKAHDQPATSPVTEEKPARPAKKAGKAESKNRSKKGNK
ncbi:MAG: hypothetical protein M3X11_19425 [Acidobacteriota bacterium]|nr:hypothetical protein [Acidobacteriota bacterium]